MLPTTNEDNTVNLNAAFVTDNSLEESSAEEESGNGNIEAETNKPDNQNEMMTGNDETVLVDEEQNAAGSSSKLVESERLTIENNEEAEVNDNFNESPAAIELTKELSELELSEAAIEAEVETEDVEREEADEEEQEDEELRAELDEDDDNIDDAVALATAEFDTESVNDDENDDNNDDIAAMQHSNYKQREDATSSDDESNAGDIEMNPEFDSEWANLAEDLANVNDHNNDLNNEIDLYDTVPVDLSNDIAVNDAAAADPNFPHNPEAEFVDIDGVITSSTMPKFEKLSVAADYTQNMK